MTKDLNHSLDNFISKTSKSKVSIIVPLYGYWKEIEENPLNIETLKVTMDRITSSVHQTYVFFVGSEDRMTNDVKNYLLTYMAAGNANGVHVEPNDSYAQYVREGLRTAMETTESAYFVVINPWTLIQNVGIDVLVDRLNYSDPVKVVSGYDLRPVTDVDTFDLDVLENYINNTPKEERWININFFGIARYSLETIVMDEKIKTSKYMELDIWQQIRVKGFECISSQRIPIFVFDMQLEAIENPADVEADKQYFQAKWGYIPEF